MWVLWVGGERVPCGGIDGGDVEYVRWSGYRLDHLCRLWGKHVS